MTRLTFIGTHPATLGILLQPVILQMYLILLVALPMTLMTRCFGHSLLTKVRRFVETFYGMTVDDTMQKILRSEEGGASVQKSMKQYKEEILEKYEQARSLIDACNIVDDPNRPRFVCSDEDD